MDIKGFIEKTKDLNPEEKNQVAARFYCTKCGKPFTYMDAMQDANIEYCMGFGSRYDESHVKMSFCTECFDALLDQLAEKSEGRIFVRPEDEAQSSEPDFASGINTLSYDEVQEIISYQPEGYESEGSRS